jgi:hypothetical protein
VDGSSISRLDGAFCCVDVAIDYLEVRESPIAEQFRPTFIPMVAPDLEQRDPVIDLSVSPQPPTCSAAPSLQATQQ